MDNSFQHVMDRLHGGDDAAAAAVFNRFAHRLIGLARSRLDGLLRNKVEPEDVLQSVFRSFFLHHAETAYDLGGWDSLWGLLTTLTVRKCGRKHRFFRQERRDLRREVSGPAEQSDASWAAWEAQDLEPLPEQATILAETVEQLLTSHDERDRQIIVLYLQGHETVEVSSQVG